MNGCFCRLRLSNSWHGQSWVDAHKWPCTNFTPYPKHGHQWGSHSQVWQVFQQPLASVLDGIVHAGWHLHQIVRQGWPLDLHGHVPLIWQILLLNAFISQILQDSIDGCRARFFFGWLSRITLLPILALCSKLVVILSNYRLLIAQDDGISLFFLLCDLIEAIQFDHLVHHLVA